MTWQFPVGKVSSTSSPSSLKIPRTKRVSVWGSIPAKKEFQNPLFSVSTYEISSSDVDSLVNSHQADNRTQKQSPTLDSATESPRTGLSNSSGNQIMIVNTKYDNQFIQTKEVIDLSNADFEDFLQTSSTEPTSEMPDSFRHQSDQLPQKGSYKKPRYETTTNREQAVLSNTKIEFRKEILTVEEEVESVSSKSNEHTCNYSYQQKSNMSTSSAKSQINDSNLISVSASRGGRSNRINDSNLLRSTSNTAVTRKTSSLSSQVRKLLAVDQTNSIQHSSNQSSWKLKRKFSSTDLATESLIMLPDNR